MAEGAWGGWQQGEGTVLGAVGHKLVMLVEATLGNATVEVESSETLLDITANRGSFLPAVDTSQLPRPLDFSNYFTVFRRNIPVENPRRKLHTE